VNQNIKNLIAVLLILGGLGFSALTIGAFTYQNPDIPSIPDIRPLTILKALEGATSPLVFGLIKLLGFTDLTKPDMVTHAFSRGFTYMGLSIVLTSLAAMLISGTRRDSIPVPGRRKGA
jgi:hypothetical protein